MRERYQRPEVQDLGTKWKIFYWDYTVTPRKKRTKTWAKSKVPNQRTAQQLADDFMQGVNERNNSPELFANSEDTLRAVYQKCRNLTWPHLKNSTRKQYEEDFGIYLLPKFGDTKLRKLTTLRLQEYFNSLLPKLSPKSIRLIHGALRAALNQAITWQMIKRNPAVGVKLPRKRQVKPTVLLPLREIRRVLDGAPEPIRSILILIVFASMRVGEVLALRWKDILRDRIIVDERVYDDEFDDVKTDAGDREVPFDRHGVILSAIQCMWERNTKYRQPEDLVFANRKGNPMDRRNLLRRNLKKAVKQLGLPKEVDFRSFRTMHGSLMRRMGARLEVARDNMGHAGNTGSITVDIYSKTWWEERVDAVTRVVEAVFTEPEQEPNVEASTGPAKTSSGEKGAEWVPFWEPQEGGDGRGERI